MIISKDGALTQTFANAWFYLGTEDIEKENIKLDQKVLDSHGKAKKPKAFHISPRYIQI